MNKMSPWKRITLALFAAVLAVGAAACTAGAGVSAAPAAYYGP